MKLTRSSDGQPQTRIYRKPTWSGLLLHFLSYAPIKYKRNLVSNLFDRAYKICSPEFLAAELSIITDTLKANGYPAWFVERYSKRRTRAEPTFGPERKQVFLNVPFIGDKHAYDLTKRLQVILPRAFPAAEPRVVHSTCSVAVRPLKDRLPPSGASNVIYQFLCDCGSSYLGRTERALSRRVDEHLPRWLMDGATHRPRSTAPPTSAVARHALECGQFDRSRMKSDHFKVVARARHRSLLPMLESCFIIQRKPPLCAQKEFVFTLKLPWN